MSFMSKKNIMNYKITTEFKRIKRWISRMFLFKNSNEYWKKRYQKGGNSGPGSYKHLAEFKAEVINQFLESENINSVIEFGCGDGNQLRFMNYSKYTGFDISATALEICKSIFHGDQTKEFKLTDDYANEKADLTLSLDVIFHLVEDKVFHDYMTRLFDSSLNFVIIYSSNTDQNPKKPSPHVKHRKFTDWAEKNAKHFKLINMIKNKFPFDGTDNTSFADFYIYRRTENI